MVHPETDAEADASTADDASDQVVDDVRTIRALAHPMRLRILDILRDGGAHTATQISEIVGESPANCAFHLRTLARYGYIEEAPGGHGRSRPWKPVSRQLIIDTEAAAPEDSRALRAVRDAIRASDEARRAAWDVEQSRAPQDWRDASFDVSLRTAITVEQLASLRDEIEAVVERYASRGRERPDGAAPVHFAAMAFPTSLAQLTAPTPPTSPPTPPRKATS
jgi:DNA-binding transcriptional ArsR family regulator